MAKHNKVGEAGEKLAVQYLKKMGYSLLAENWRSGRNEIDVIARIGDTVAFVEVKTRSTAYFGHPSDAVSMAKQRRVIQAANDFLEQYDQDVEARFDVIAVTGKGSAAVVDHMVDAFHPMA